jgi:pilus assembly protein FimV
MLDNATIETEVETTEDFSSRFAADFDFVKTLDSNQVTLDLASQYVQLGEYDSAKRLLTEVINQGNSEQQSQAQALLDRTA